MVCLPWADTDQCFNVSEAYFRWLFRMTVSVYCSSNDYFGCLFVIPRLILILPTNSYFHGRFLFQPIIQLIGPTTDWFLNDGFLLHNYGPDPPWYVKELKIIMQLIIKVNLDCACGLKLEKQID